MSKELIGSYLFVDNLYKGADLQRKQQEISRLKNDLQRQRQAAANANAFPNAGMVNRADYELMKEKVAFYEKLLTEPLNVIADKLEAKVPEFKENYDKEQLLLADWIVSQKAFKETAMKYGEMAGKTKDEIQKEGLNTEEKVLNSTTKFGNNVETSPLANELKDKLKKM
jgi:hypothetical protein